MKTAEQLSKIFDDVYLSVEQHMGDASEADYLLFTSQAELADAKSKILMSHDPADLGKNEAQREAKIADLTKAERQRVRDSERRRHEARAALEIALLRKERARADLRLLELASPASDLAPLRLG